MRKLPIILQDEISECGLASVNMVANYYGHDLDLQALRGMHNSSLHGSNVLDLVKLLEQLGMRARVLRIELDDLRTLRTPAILHWNLNHFVVLKEIKHNKCIIHDPASGIRSCNMDEVSDFFTGIALEIDQASDFSALKARQQISLIDIMRHTQGIANALLLLFVFTLIIESLGLINPLFVQYITDYGIKTGDIHNLLILASGFGFLALVQMLAEYVRARLVLFMKNNLNEQFSANTVMHILRLPLCYFEKRHKGDIQSRFNAIEQIQRKISIDFITTFFDGILIVLTFAVMFYYNRNLTGIIMLALLISVMITYVTWRSVRHHTENALTCQANSSTVFLETLQGMLAIKSFGKESSRFNTWHNAYLKYLNVDIKISQINIWSSIAQKLLQSLEYIVVLYVGAILIIHHDFSVGMLVAFLAYRLLLVNKTRNFIQNLFEYKMISIHLSRLRDIILHDPEIVTSNNYRKTVTGALRLENISFRYEEKQLYVIKDFNLQINPGEKIAITGPSGCGKTTLLKIMMGLLVPDSGKILLDGNEINSFGLREYRNISACVMQEDILLKGSLLQNITFFDTDIDLDLVYKSAQLAQIHDEILQMPMGYETLCGDMGSVFSGGQKQRILLARALYRQPRILFLDEATSHLDVANEKNINTALRELAITQVIIAHRQETIAMADRVVVLGGKI